MKEKRVVNILGAALLFLLFFLPGCQKDSLLPSLDEGIRAPWQVPAEVVPYFSDAEISQIETAYEQALSEYTGEKTVIPMMVAMNVRLSYTPLMRGSNEGKGEVHLALSGAGHWQCVSRVQYFEVQYEPGIDGFWVGEGWLQKAGERPALSFRSHCGCEYFSEYENGSYEMVGILDITGGTYAFQGANGEAIRKVVVSEDDFTSGYCILYGYVVLPGRTDAVFEVSGG